MKKVVIQVVINENEMASAVATVGYSKKKISDQLEILGIMENLVETQKAKLKVFGRKQI